MSDAFIRQVFKMIIMIYLDNQNNRVINPLSANPTKWSNTLKQFVGKLETNCLSVFDHFVGLVLKELRFYETFWSVHKDTFHKLIYAHENIGSIINKYEFLSIHINPSSPGKNEKHDFWNSNNSTNFKHQ